MLILGFGLLWSNAILADGISCPRPEDFLGHTMTEAKQTMSKLFPANWDFNGPLCSTDYSNLMTRQQKDVCNEPAVINRVIITGPTDSGNVIGIFYILPGNIETTPPPAWLSMIAGEKLLNTDKIPSEIRPLLKTQPGRDWSLQSSKGRFFIYASSKTDPNQTGIAIIDMHAVANQRKSFEACLKQMGYQN